MTRWVALRPGETRQWYCGECVQLLAGYGSNRVPVKCAAAKKDPKAPMRVRYTWKHLQKRKHPEKMKSLQDSLGKWAKEQLREMLEQNKSKDSPNKNNQKDRSLSRTELKDSLGQLLAVVREAQSQTCGLGMPGGPRVPGLV